MHGEHHMRYDGYSTAYAWFDWKDSVLALSILDTFNWYRDGAHIWSVFACFDPRLTISVSIARNYLAFMTFQSLGKLSGVSWWLHPGPSMAQNREDRIHKLPKMISFADPAYIQELPMAVLTSMKKTRSWAGWQISWPRPAVRSHKGPWKD